MVHLGAGVAGSWSSLVEEQIEVVATQTIQKVNKRPGKHFSLWQGIGEKHQSDSSTNYIDWSDGQAISTKECQYNMAINRSLGMRWDEETKLKSWEVILWVMVQVHQVSNTSLALEH